MCTYRSQETVQLLRDKWQLAQVAQEGVLGSAFLVLRANGKRERGGKGMATSIQNAFDGHPPDGGEGRAMATSTHKHTQCI